MKEVKKKNEMPLKHETYKGTFTDYRGMSRDFTMVAVSIPVKEDLAVYETHMSFDIETENDCQEIYAFEYNSLKKYPGVTQASTYTPLETKTKISPIRKMLAIGVAVRCNRDKDLGLGEFIAYGKALRNASNGTGHVLFVSHGGMINTMMVQALLAQEAEHFMKDPGSYIKGYNIDRDRYFKTGHIAMAELTAEEYSNRTGSPIADVNKVLKPVTKEYSTAKVLNEKEEAPQTFGSPITANADIETNTDIDAPVVDDSAGLIDVEPDNIEDERVYLGKQTPVQTPVQTPAKTPAKTLIPMQQRLRRFNNN